MDALDRERERSSEVVAARARPLASKGDLLRSERLGQVVHGTAAQASTAGTHFGNQRPREDAILKLETRVRTLVLIAWLLGALTGAFDIKVALVRPDCCHSPDSCCPADHSADCCQKKLHVTFEQRPEQALRSAEKAPELAGHEVVAISAPVVYVELDRLAQPPGPRDERAGEPPPRSLSQTTILRF